MADGRIGGVYDDFYRTLSNIDITNVAADTTNVVWIDNGSEEWKNAPVTVNGGNCIVEP